MKGQVKDRTKCKRVVLVLQDKSQNAKHRDLYISDQQMTVYKNRFTQARSFSRRLPNNWIHSMKLRSLSFLIYLSLHRLSIARQQN
jgi:hypothetical protein